MIKIMAMEINQVLAETANKREWERVWKQREIEMWREKEKRAITRDVLLLCFGVGIDEKVIIS